MDPDDLKEMLFGFPSSQDCLQQDCSEDFLGSDLDAAPDEDDYYDWDLNSNSPMLHSTPSDYDHNLALLDDPDQVGADGTSSPVHKFSSSTSITNDKDRVIARIEGILEGIVDGLLDNKTELSIVLKTRAGASRRSNGVAGSLDTAPSPKRRKIAFPGANTQEAWRFSNYNCIF
jgi:meiotic recombination protein SPO11